MKVALCFSGILRDVNETKAFWKDLIKEYDIDVYASFWDIENESLGDTIKQFETIYTPKRLEVENYKIFKESTLEIAKLHINSPNLIDDKFQKASNEFGMFPMYYKIWKCNLLTKELGIKYDVVIRARIDTVLDNMFKIEKNDMLNVPMGVTMVPAFHNSGGMNDCFAYGNPKIMDYYSFCFFQLMEYLKDGHYIFPPEHILSVHFSKIHIPIRFFENYMMITRVWKGGDHEVYNKFIGNPKEIISYSDDVEFIPDLIGSFKKDSIKDDFIV